MDRRRTYFGFVSARLVCISLDLLKRIIGRLESGELVVSKSRSEDDMSVSQ